MRAGTENLYGIVGFAKALEMAIAKHGRRKHVILKEVRDYMKESLLKNIPGSSF